MAAQKCKNILLQAALKDFWSSANPKLKNDQNSHFFRIHTEENARMGVLGSYFCLQMIYNIAPLWIFRKKLNFEGLQTYERHESHLMS